jgi:hypothetical protein
MRTPLLASIAAMALMSAAGHQEPPRYRREKAPKPKSTHKRAHKGSKAAKRKSRKA